MSCPAGSLRFVGEGPIDRWSKVGSPFGSLSSWRCPATRGLTQVTQNNSLEAEIRSIVEGARQQIVNTVLKHYDPLISSILMAVPGSLSAPVSSGITESDVLAYLLDKEPHTMTALGKALGVETPKLAPIVKALCRDGRLLKSGTSRATKYSLNPAQSAAASPEDAA